MGPVADVVDVDPLVAGCRRCGQLAVLVMDQHIPYSENAETWRTNLAEPELALIKAALGTEKSLQKVLAFAPSVADQAKRQALVAIGLACLAMAVYLWFRFGAMEFGVDVPSMVATAFGAGRFTLKEWMAEGGYDNSQKGER